MKTGHYDVTKNNNHCEIDLLLKSRWEALTMLRLMETNEKLDLPCSSFYKRIIFTLYHKIALGLTLHFLKRVSIHVIVLVIKMCLS